MEKDMKRRLLFICLLAICCIYTLPLSAQSAGLHFSVGVPSGEFKDNVKRVGIGLNGNFMLFNSTPGLPYSLGLNIGFMNYGSESRREPFSSTIPDVVVDVDRSNNLVNFHLMFQIIPPSGNVRPYLETLFGGSYFFTQTTINSRGDEEVASSTNFDDFAWSYGGGAGILINLIKFDEPQKKVSSVFLDFKVRYLFGTEAEYLKEGSVTIVNGRAYYDLSKSKTDLLTFHIGATVFFSSLFETE